MIIYGAGAGGNSSADLECAAQTVGWPFCWMIALFITGKPGSALLEICTTSRCSVCPDGSLKEGEQVRIVSFIHSRVAKKAALGHTSLCIPALPLAWHHGKPSNQTRGQATHGRRQKYVPRLQLNQL